MLSARTLGVTTNEEFKWCERLVVAEMRRGDLRQQGVLGDRLATKSMGEKMPMVEGTDNESFAANRRGEFVLYVPMAAQPAPATGSAPQRINLVPGAATP